MIHLVPTQQKKEKNQWHHRKKNAIKRENANCQKRKLYDIDALTRIVKLESKIKALERTHRIPNRFIRAAQTKMKNQQKPSKKIKHKIRNK